MSTNITHNQDSAESSVQALNIGPFNNSLLLSVYGDLYVINLDLALFFEADDHYTHVYYTSGVHFMIQFGLAQVEAAIAESIYNTTHFVRLSRKYIVNAKRIFHINMHRQIIVLCDDKGVNHNLRMPKNTLRNLIDTINKKEYAKGNSSGNMPDSEIFEQTDTQNNN